MTGLAKVRFDSQLVKTNRALVNYAGQLAQDHLLPTRLPDKAQKPRKTYGKASTRSLTKAEAAEKIADRQRRAVRYPAGR